MNKAKEFDLSRQAATLSAESISHRCIAAAVLLLPSATRYDACVTAWTAIRGTF